MSDTSTPADDGRRLYGMPGAEYLNDTAAECYEADVDQTYEPGEVEKVTIEEWTVHPTRHHLPTVLTIVDYLSEWVADNGEVMEEVGESFETAIYDDEVAEAVDELLDLIASKVTGTMADRMVATHEITWGAEGEPLLDGEPLYTKRMVCPRCNGLGKIKDRLTAALSWSTLTCPECIGTGSVAP